VPDEFVAVEAVDRERLLLEVIGDRLQLAVERLAP
jgi:hypothetical protein